MSLDRGTRASSPACWIIAYGNPQRSDDGIGLFVSRKLRRHFGQDANVGIRTLPQLDLTLLEEVQTADYLILVDACVDEGNARPQWSMVEPELSWAMRSHCLSPGVFVGLLQLLYERRPTAWLVSVPGYCFDLEERLSLDARRNADLAARQIVEWLSIHRIIG